MKKSFWYKKNVVKLLKVSKRISKKSRKREIFGFSLFSEIIFEKSKNINKRVVKKKQIE